MVNITIYYGLLQCIPHFTIFHYGEYHNLLWFTIVNTMVYYGLLEYITYFTMVYHVNIMHSGS